MLRPSRFRILGKKLTIRLLLTFLLLTISACDESTLTNSPTTAQNTTVPQPNNTVPLPTTANSTTTVAATPAANASPINTIQSVATAIPAPASDRAFEKVFIIVLENTDYPQAMAQSYLKNLAGKGANLTNFFAITHPSYPNYLALTAGSTFGITDDGQTDLDKTNIVDLLETKGISWKVYVEQYPDNPCYKGIISNGYVRKHTPMLSFVDVQNSPARCAKIVPSKQLAQDVAANNLPQYSLYIPDLDNDGHDTGVAYASKWLQGFLTPLQDNKNFSAGTAVVVTFDEGLNGSTNQIYTIFVGEPVKPGTSNNTRYTHYDLLRTIEDNFKLGNLGREDAKASFISGVWRNHP